MKKSLKIDIFNSFKTKSFEDEDFSLSGILLIPEHYQKSEISEVLNSFKGDLK